MTVLREESLGSQGWIATLAAMYLCPGEDCGLPSLLLFDADIGSGTYATLHVKLHRQFPRGSAEPMDDLPAEIQRDRMEAWSCFHGGDLRAALLMARAAVQRAVRTLDAKRGSLNSEIDDLLEQRKITPDLRDMAHEVRLAGNDAAHPEQLGDVTDADVRDSLAFMEDFLRVTVALPERQRQRRAAREAD